jgi:large subunit ribosomal protein L32
MKLVGPTLVECPNCGNSMLMHRVCKCGFYRGKQVFSPETKA